MLIGKLKSLTQDSQCKRLLDVLDLESDKASNIKSLLKAPTLKEHLTLTTKFLLSLDSEFPPLVSELGSSKVNTKTDLANVIVDFVTLAQDSKCPKCLVDYTPCGPTNCDAEFNCFKCSRPCHQGCYANIQVQPKYGIVFLCLSCISLAVPATPVDPKDETPPPSDLPVAPKEETPPPSDAPVVPKDTEADHSTPAASKEPPPPKDTKPNGEKQKDAKLTFDRTQQVCKLLKAGKCPHGITGKSNGECPSYHPPFCFRFQKNGPNGNHGCRKGKQCSYYHPTMCRNGLNDNMCLDKNCKFTHIRGCKRKASAKYPGQPSASLPSSNQIKSQTSNPVVQPINHSISTRSSSGVNQNPWTGNGSEKHDNSDFLMHLAQLRADMTTMIQEVVQSTLMKLQSRQFYQQMPTTMSSPFSSHNPLYQQNFPPLNHPVQAHQM